MKKRMIIVIDGCAPDYLTPQTAPNIYKLCQKNGFAKTVLGAVPTVTNVNHACIMSGSFPSNTHVVGNYFYDRDTDAQGFIEGKGFMKAETIFQKVHAAGGKSALLTVKGKILDVFGADADIGINVQNPDMALLSRLNLPAPPEVQSPESSQWIFQAAYACIETENPDLVYCTTNDFIMHHYGPETEEAKAQISVIDQYVKKIYDLDSDREIYITADHGMNQKTTLINMQNIADDAGFHAVCIPPLKDRYIENHIYQEGGIMYLFLKDLSEKDAIFQYFSSFDEVEQILTAQQAAQQYDLPVDDIGDLVVFAAEGCAFGEVPHHRLTTNAVRTHGSLYEREVPLMAINPGEDASHYTYSKDIIGSFQ